MSTKLEELELFKSYNFDVKLSLDTHVFSGELSLTPEKITFEIIGELSKEREFKLHDRTIERLICRDTNKTFILIGLRNISGRARLISTQPDSIVFFRKKYEVNYVFFSPTEFLDDKEFYGFNIYSHTLNTWLGHTKIQSQLLEDIHKEDTEEFITTIDNIGYLGINYDSLSFFDHLDAGVKISPYLFFLKKSSGDILTIIEIFQKTRDLMTFICGGSFDIQKIIIKKESHPSYKPVTLYYIQKKSKQETILFPLSKEEDVFSLGLPKYPIHSFNIYFNLSDENISCISKYDKYKKMNNPEDRFLGYFRLLEKLNIKKKSYLNDDLLKATLIKYKPCLEKIFNDKENVSSFIKNISRYNHSKYNTSKCIQDFYVQISRGISNHWIYKKKDIDGICKLRNDITHANDYYISELDLIRKTLFIEVLLILSLFRLIGIELNEAEKIIHRLDGYFLIVECKA